MAGRPEQSTKSQYERFKEAALELDACEDEAAFHESLRRIAEAQPPRRPKGEKSPPQPK